MAKVEIYTTQYCPYCVRAKQFFATKGIEFTEHNLEGKHDELVALKERTGMRTVPQIFINDELIGGFDDMMALESRGELDSKLKG